MLLKQLSCHSVNMVGHTDLETRQSHPVLHLPHMAGRGSCFPGLVLPNYTANSEFLVGIKPCDSSVVTGYQADEFTSHLFSAVFCCLIKHAPSVHRHSVNTDPIPA